MKRYIITTMVLVVLTVAGTIAWHLRPVQHDFFTDADTIKTPADSAMLRDILWQPPIQLPENINNHDRISEPAVSHDGMTLYFAQGGAGDNSDLYFSLRTADGWSQPRPLQQINTDFDEMGPEISADGNALYFYSDRPGGIGGYDLWVAHRDQDGWQTPVNLGAEVNSDFDDYGPAITPDGQTIYFSSNRNDPKAYLIPDPPEGEPVITHEELGNRSYNLYQATNSNGVFDNAQAVVALNSKYNEGSPAVSPFDDFLYFTSDRPGGMGGYDLYRTRRVDGEFLPVQHLGEEINTSANELDPVLSLGGYALYFSSNREKVVLNTDAQAKSIYRIFYTTSREVYRDFESIAVPPFNFGAWWSRIGPSLLWALFALTMLILFWAMMKSLSERRVSLLAKCLMASMALHMMLLFLFNVWQVGSSLAGELQRRGRIQIALASPTTGGEIASQIRGKAGEIQPPAMQETVTQRPDNIPESTPESAMAKLTVDRYAMTPHESPEAILDTTDATIDRSLDVPRPETQTEITNALATFELTTENNPTRIETAEAKPVKPIETNQPTQMYRPDVMVHPNRTVVAEVTPSVNQQQTLTPIEKASLLPQVLANDAQPALPMQSQVADQPFTTEPWPMSELTPTVASVSRPAQVTEAKIQVAATMTPPPRAEIAQGVIAPPAPIEAGMKQIQPSSVPYSPDASSLDTTQFAHASDVTPSFSSSHDQSDQEYEVETSSIHNLALPAMEESSAVATNESLDLKPSTNVQPLRGVLAQTQSFAPETLSIQQLVPTTSTPQVIDNSLADARLEKTIDSTPIPLTEFMIAWETPKPSLPQLITLELPAMEENNSSLEEETAYVLNSVEPYKPRAMTGKEALTDPIPARTAYFKVATTKLPDNPKDRFVDAMVDRRKNDHPRFMPVSFSESIDDMRISSLALDLPLPVEERAPASLYLHRTSPSRLEIVERMGGSEKTEKAVELALKWLARHQHRDGHWDTKNFDKKCGGCGGQTDIEADVALTGLATLCFLGAGHSHITDGPYQDNLARSIRWLVKQQDDDGSMRGKETMYTQAIATIAMSESFGMTGDQSLVDPIQRAIRFLYQSHNRQEGGWRYDPGQVGDTSVLGWVLMAFKSASMSGIEVPRHGFDIARAWLNKVGGASEAGLYSYKPGHRFTPSMTAEAMFSQELLGTNPSDPRMNRSVDLIMQNLPDWDADPNTYYWYYATLALFQQQGDAWKIWNKVLTRELLNHQQTQGKPAGSWDPQGEWASVAGRIYQTTMCTLMLEVYYRYLPMYSLEDPNELAIPEGSIGSISGMVTDATTDRPLSNTTILLDLPEGETVTAETDADGHYVLYVPQVPVFFALSATREGYVPETTNVSGEMIRHGPMNLDFELEPSNTDIIVTEAIPEVHHLGDNRFDGSINSQFQKESEGSSYAAQFELSEKQVKPYIRRAKVHLLAKGVQRRHKIFINGHVLKKRLNHAPRDGSFGEFEAPLEVSLLRAGTNTIEIVAAPSDHDIDDFEFVNVQIHLIP